MEISGVSAKTYTSAAAAIDEDEELKEAEEEKASEEAAKTEKKEGDKVDLSSQDDYSESDVEEKAANYIQNIIASTNLTEASKAQLQQYLNSFDVAKFIKSYGPFTSTAEISAAMYAVTSGMIKRQEDE